MEDSLETCGLYILLCSTYFLRVIWQIENIERLCRSRVFCIFGLEKGKG